MTCNHCDLTTNVKRDVNSKHTWRQDYVKTQSTASKFIGIKFLVSQMLRKTCTLHDEATSLPSWSQHKENSSFP